MNKNRHLDSEQEQVAREAVMSAIEKQLEDNEPPETKEALERLLAMGETRESAMR